VKIARIELIPMEIPFHYGGPKVLADLRAGITPRASGKPGEATQLAYLGRDWTHIEFLLIRMETDTGVVGWGETWGFRAVKAIKAALEEMVIPMVIGRDCTDIHGLMHQLQRDIHLMGRYGVTIWALAGIDLCLWDIAGKVAGLPLYRLLGAGATRPLPAYLSLFFTDSPDHIREAVKSGVAGGFKAVKLHSTKPECLKAAREAGGDDIELMVDVNCAWTLSEARTIAPRLMEYNLSWLEEPIFPPEHYTALAQLRRETGVPIAAGENACTSFEFHQMFEAGAVTVAQPNVVKCGGIREFRKVSVLAEHYGVRVIGHNVNWGPAFLAGLHVTACEPRVGLIEYFLIYHEAHLYPELINPVDGHFRLPDAPGLGPDPDPDVVKKYRLDR
jgi:D-galactarolactone cycloisomerase